MDNNVERQPSPRMKRMSAIANALDAAGNWLWRIFLISLHHLFAFAPLLALIAVYAFSWRVAGIIGYWPQPSINDPQYPSPNDDIALALHESVIVFLLISVAGVLFFPLLTYFLRKWYSRRWLVVLIAVFVIGCLLLRLDPGSRFGW